MEVAKRRIVANVVRNSKRIMKSYIVLLPTSEITNLIFDLRRELVKLGFGGSGDRFSTLPHVTISYLSDTSDSELNNMLFQELDQVVAHTKTYKLSLKKFTDWGGNIVAMFNNETLFSLTSVLEEVLSRHKISGNQEYFDSINIIEKNDGSPLSTSIPQVLGDHMKILREIDGDRISEAKQILAKKLPEIFIFDRICLIKHGCRDEDIVWSNYLK